MDKIPLVDLTVQHGELAAEVLDAVRRVIESGSFVLGSPLEEFERAFAEYAGGGHFVGVASGTDALELMVRAAGIGAGDEVIAPANSFIATALAVVRAGATPALVDCDPAYLLMDPEAVEACVTERTKAVIAVHLYGQMAPLERLEQLCAERGLVLLEDCAQAHGATRLGRPAGSWGAAGAFSFYPSKNLGALGDGGGVMTGSEQLARRVRALRNHGSESNRLHPEMGFNSRLDNLQAAVLAAKLKRLSAWNEARRRAAATYRSLLADLTRVVLPETLAGNDHVWHLFVVRVPDRDEVHASLRADGIGAGIHYPLPIHLEGACRFLGHGPGDFPNAEAASREVLSLPLYPGITQEQQEIVSARLRKAVS
ncbi:MAG: DegT/DnrJ/EryC1/StrS family aminotransferase [Actinomycetota bacterium]